MLGCHAIVDRYKTNTHQLSCLTPVRLTEGFHNLFGKQQSLLNNTLARRLTHVESRICATSPRFWSHRIVSVYLR